MMYLHKKIRKVKIKLTNKIKYDQKINGYVVIIQISFGPKLVAYSDLPRPSGYEDPTF